MKPATRSKAYQDEMRRTIAKYTDLVGLTPEKFLNGFLKFFLVDPHAERESH